MKNSGLHTPESKIFSKILEHFYSVLLVRMKVSERPNIAEIIDGVAVTRRQSACIYSARILSKITPRENQIAVTNISSDVPLFIFKIIV